MRLAPALLTSLASLTTLARTARAEHEHGGHPEPDAASLAITATIGTLAAAYDSMFFAGDYQGVAGALGVSRRSFAMSAAISGYRLTRNGKLERGAGDLLVHAQLRLARRGDVSLGSALGVMLPTGDSGAGLGMGHPMIMPAVFATWTPDRASLTVSASYCRGVGDESVHARHGGVWPLVDPMNYQEVAFGVAASYALAQVLSAGVRITGAAPIGDGTSRLTGGVRVTWTEGRVETSFELAGGFVGDPYSVRGVLTTSLRFE
jgi:hypothetical protein